MQCWSSSNSMVPFSSLQYKRERERDYFIFPFLKFLSGMFYLPVVYFLSRKFLIKGTILSLRLTTQMFYI